MGNGREIIWLYLPQNKDHRRPNRRPGSGKMRKEAGVLSKKMEVRERGGGSERRLKSKERLLGCPHRKIKGSFLLPGRDQV